MMRACLDCGRPFRPKGSRRSRCIACHHTAAQRGYDYRWQRFSRAYLAANPACARGCGRRATDVHHIDGRGPLGPRGYDPTNLEALCHSCHSQVTARG
jgi:5-methylcytosine-specific restriction enzyme A